MSISEELGIIGATLFIITIFFTIISIISSILIGLHCESKYEDSTYSFFGGCKINYEGNYIPESLYERAFEQNLNINK